MNPEIPQSPREELEASLTALLLGELPADKAAALRLAIEKDAELSKLHDRLKTAITLVRETAATPEAQLPPQPAPLKLSEDKRQKLLAHFKTVAPKQFAQPRRKREWLIPLSAAAAMIAITCFFLFSIESRREMFSVSTLSDKQVDVVADGTELLSMLRREHFQRVQTRPAYSTAAPAQGGTNVYSLDVGGYHNVDTKTPRQIIANELSVSTLPTMEPAEKGHEDVSALAAKAASPKSARTPIVLPAATEFASAPQPSVPVPALQPPDHGVTPNSFWDINRHDSYGLDNGRGTTPPPQVAAQPRRGGETSSPLTQGELAQNFTANSDWFGGLGGKPSQNQFGSRAAADGITFQGGTAPADATRKLDVARQSAPASGSSGSGPTVLFNNRVAKPSPPKVTLQGGTPPVGATRKSEATDLFLAPGAQPPIVVADVDAVQKEVQTGLFPEAATITPPSSVSGSADLGTSKTVTTAGAVQNLGQLIAKSSNGALTLNGGNTFGDFDGSAFISTNSIAAYDWSFKAGTLDQPNLTTLGANEGKPKDVELALDDAGPSGRAGRTLRPETEASDEVQVLRENLNYALPTSTNSFAIAANKTPEYDRETFYRLRSKVDTDTKLPANDGSSQTVLPQLQTDSAARVENRGVENKSRSVRDALGKHDSALTKMAAARKVPKSQGDTNLEKEQELANDYDAQKAKELRPYLEKKKQLEELQRFRQILSMKITSEKIDQALPKTLPVQIVDPATAEQSKSPSLWERFGNKVSGKVERSARIKIERDVPDVAGLAEPKSMTAYDPHFVQTEFETIQSDPVLKKVVQDLNLDAAWAKKSGSGPKLTTTDAIALLRKKLDLRPVKDTSFIEIGAKSDKPEEAATIANAVATAYQEFRQEQKLALSKSGVTALEERWHEKEAEVARVAKEVEDLRAKLGIPDVAALENGNPGSLMSADADVSPPKPPANAPIPQPEIQTCNNAFSTFSLNVSDVSFKLAAASLEKGTLPDVSTVRSEEFLNAFNYRDPEAPLGAPLAFAWERARYPFAQNRDLLRFSLKTAAQGRQSGRPLNLVLLLDNSGSMERADRVHIIHEALRVLASQLQEHDKLSVVTFARTPRLWVDGVPGSQAAKLVDEVSGLTPQGGTNLEDAMNLAYQTALRHYLANGINRVVLLTDGAANLGNVEPDALKQKVETNRKQGIALDCFGIGWDGYNDDLLEALSRNGDGRYGFINTPEEAATDFAAQLAGALHVAASDVKVQVEFNPNRITAYRQIGYAKHQLTKEQFRDNTVDAAELAAAESGNALYVIEVNPRGEGPLGTVRARYKIPGTTDYREHEWAVPYTGNAASLEQSSPAMRLAATAAAFSEWLVSSPYAAEVTPDRLLGYLNNVPDTYGADGRPKKLEWMIRQAKSIAGK